MTAMNSWTTIRLQYNHLGCYQGHLAFLAFDTNLTHKLKPDIQVRVDSIKQALQHHFLNSFPGISFLFAFAVLCAYAIIMKFKSKKEVMGDTGGQVIGLIGDDIEDFHTDEDKIYISLWSEPQKKARNADIDVLEISPGHQL